MGVNMWKELEGKEIAVFDGETDGFLDNMTTIHCITWMDAITKEKWAASDTAGNPRIILNVLDEYDGLVGHNIIGFDLPMLKQE